MTPQERAEAAERLAELLREAIQDRDDAYAAIRIILRYGITISQTDHALIAAAIDKSRALQRPHDAMTP